MQPLDVTISDLPNISGAICGSGGYGYGQVGVGLWVNNGLLCDNMLSIENMDVDELAGGLPLMSGELGTGLSPSGLPCRDFNCSGLHKLFKLCSALHRFFKCSCVYKAFSCSCPYIDFKCSLPYISLRCSELYRDLSCSGVQYKLSGRWCIIVAVELIFLTQQSTKNKLFTQ